MNLDQIAPYARYLADIGVDGVYILGTTGESFLLTQHEKIAVLEAWSRALRQLDRRLVAVVNCSAMSGRDVDELVRLTDKLDLDGIALLAPLYYSVSTREDLVAYFDQILRRTGCELPLLYYHSMRTTAVNNCEWTGQHR